MHLILIVSYILCINANVIYSQSESNLDVLEVKPCRINEVWNSCKMYQVYLEDGVFLYRCVGGCVCIPNFQLDANTKLCYDPTIPICCPPNSKLDRCGGFCGQVECKNKFPICTEIIQCIPICRCNPPYIMDRNTVKCVPESNCS